MSESDLSGHLAVSFETQRAAYHYLSDEVVVGSRIGPHTDDQSTLHVGAFVAKKYSTNRENSMVWNQQMDEFMNLVKAVKEDDKAIYICFLPQDFLITDFLQFTTKYGEQRVIEEIAAAGSPDSDVPYASGEDDDGEGLASLQVTLRLRALLRMQWDTSSLKKLSLTTMSAQQQKKIPVESTAEVAKLMRSVRPFGLACNDQMDSFLSLVDAGVQILRSAYVCWIRQTWFITNWSACEAECWYTECTPEDCRHLCHHRIKRASSTARPILEEAIAEGDVAVVLFHGYLGCRRSCLGVVIETLSVLKE